MKRKILRRCKCGCGEITKSGNKYIFGHHLFGNTFKRDKKASKETRKKMSLAKIGNMNRRGTTHTKETKDKMILTRQNVSEETRNKISLALTNNTNATGKRSKEVREAISKQVTGNGNPFYGKHHTEETKRESSCRMKLNNPMHSFDIRLKVSKALQNRYKNREHHLCGNKLSEETKGKISIATSGSNNPAWLGGISFEPYCIDWNNVTKDAIKERDNHECQNSDCKHNCDHLSLCVHHVDYNKKNCEPRNLITLCISCNARANTNRKYWELIYRDVLNTNRLGLANNKYK